MGCLWRRRAHWPTLLTQICSCPAARLCRFLCALLAGVCHSHSALFGSSARFLGLQPASYTTVGHAGMAVCTRANSAPPPPSLAAALHHPHIICPVHHALRHPDGGLWAVLYSNWALPAMLLPQQAPAAACRCHPSACTAHTYSGPPVHTPAALLRARDWPRGRNHVLAT